jgi:micrococcal nuclease
VTTGAQTNSFCAACGAAKPQAVHGASCSVCGQTAVSLTPLVTLPLTGHGRLPVVIASSLASALVIGLLVLGSIHTPAGSTSVPVAAVPALAATSARPTAAANGGQGTTIEPRVAPSNPMAEAMVLATGSVTASPTRVSELTSQPTIVAPGSTAATDHVTTATSLSTETLYDVAAVVDGDTLKVARTGGRQETVRLIGIDTPEVVDPREPVQCFGREASDHAKELLLGKRVKLEEDPTQGSRDVYGRVLAYVWLEDGTFVNEVMIGGGFAQEYTYRNPYRYQADFRAAEAEARATESGLWSPETCNGDTRRPADSPTATPPPPTATARPQPASTRVVAPTATRAPQPASKPSTTGDPYYANCTAARAAGAAPILRGQPGYRRALDGDNDGIACE